MIGRMFQTPKSPDSITFALQPLRRLWRGQKSSEENPLWQQSWRGWYSWLHPWTISQISSCHSCVSSDELMILDFSGSEKKLLELLQWAESEWLLLASRWNSKKLPCPFGFLERLRESWNNVAPISARVFAFFVGFQSFLPQQAFLVPEARPPRPALQNIRNKSMCNVNVTFLNIFFAPLDG